MWSNLVLFGVLLGEIPAVCSPHDDLRVLVILFHVICPVGVSLMSFLFPYFTLELFCFLRIRLLVCPRAFSTYLLLKCSFVILKYPVFLCFSVSLSLFYSAHIFWFIYLTCIVRLFYFALFHRHKFLYAFTLGTLSFVVAFSLRVFHA